MRKTAFLILFWLFSAVLFPLTVAGQSFDASWYRADQPHVKIGVTSDGVYRVFASDIVQAGYPIAGINPGSLKLIENGGEIPIRYEGNPAVLENGSFIEFIGKRNDGSNEQWAYESALAQSSTFYSLFSDTTWYWLTWGGSSGLRYADTDPEFFAAGAAETTRGRIRIHTEPDTQDLYFFGDGDNQPGNPLFTRGEGYYWFHLENRSGDALERDEFIPFPRLSRNASDSLRVSVRINGANSVWHDTGLAVELERSGSREYMVLDRVDWMTNGFLNLSATVSQADLPETGGVNVRVIAYNDRLENRPIAQIDYIELVGFQELAFEPDSFSSFEHPAIGRRTFTISAAGSETVHIFSPRDRRYFQLTPDAGDVAFSNFLSEPGQPFYMTSRDHFSRPVAILGDVASDLANSGNRADYVILTTAFLRPSADQMAAYRAAASGYDVLVVDIQDIFDQFDYGRPTPIAIRRFLLQTRSWQTTPRFALLWGDALYAHRGTANQPWEVPSFGRPSSDAWFAMGAAGPRDWTEWISIGRMNVRTNEAATGIVLPKLSTYDSSQPAAWQKKALMMSGGFSETEQAILEGHVSRWGSDLRGNPTGMDTTFFARKDSESVFDNSHLDSLQSHISRGAALMTYFGHSSAFDWELVTYDPPDWQNSSRLPVILSLGCTTGAFAGDANSDANIPVFGEDLVVGSTSGGIAHWGGSGSSFIGHTAAMVDAVFPVFTQDSVRTLGDIFRFGKRKFLDRFPDGFDPASQPFEVMHVLMYNLIGDPSLQVKLATQPEWAVTDQDISTSPRAPVPADSSISVTVRIHNHGLVPADSVTITLSHTSPMGQTTLYSKQIPPVRVEDHVIFDVNISDSNVGENQFIVFADAADAFVESNEMDNMARSNVTVFSNGVVVVSPADFGVSQSQRPRLRVGSYFLQANGRVFFEIDTVRTFDSAARRFFDTEQRVPATDWNLDFDLKIGKTYFWRARPSLEDQDENWATAAFTVRPDLSDGWLMQGPLFSNAEPDPFITYDGQNWVFASYSVAVAATSENGNGQFKGQFEVNGETFERLGLGYGVLVLDGNSGEVKDHTSRLIYPTNRRDATEEWAAFRQTVANADDGDLLFFRTRNFFIPEDATIPDSIRTFFRDLGSTAIDTLDYRDLWTMATRKGFPQQTREAAAVSTEEMRDLRLEQDYSFTLPEARVRLPFAGPAKSWKTLDWRVTSGEPSSGTITAGLTNMAGTDVITNQSVPPAINLESIPAGTNRFLSVDLRFRDPTQANTPQLESVFLGFDRFAELALDPEPFAAAPDTLKEGELLDVSISVVNLSDTPATRTRFSWLLTGPDNRTEVVATDSLEVLLPDAEKSFSRSFQTGGRSGLYTLAVRADQLNSIEPHAFNNVLARPVFIVPDEKAPLYSLSIDGKMFAHDPNPVVNRDNPVYPFVRAQPVIEIELRDPEGAAALTDPALFSLSLNGQDVHSDSPDISFTPAGSSSDEARLVFSPDFSGQDSTYTLVFQAQDAAGNRTERYQTHFRVQSTFQIESLYPYPNPMTKRTVFAFRLRGADTATIEEFRIRIFTLSGRLVRELDIIDEPWHLDAGSLQIDWNKIAWDVRDADGDDLGTGTYIYTVLLTSEGKRIAVNNESGVEKLVVIR